MYFFGYDKNLEFGKVFFGQKMLQNSKYFAKYEEILAKYAQNMRKICANTDNMRSAYPPLCNTEC